jgi:uncharacterized protein YjbJ (UPF0337 family)
MGGAKNRAKGKVQRTAGKITGNRKLQAKGAAEEMAGRTQGWWGRLRSRLSR